MVLASLRTTLLAQSAQRSEAVKAGAKHQASDQVGATPALEIVCTNFGLQRNLGFGPAAACLAPLTTRKGWCAAPGRCVDWVTSGSEKGFARPLHWVERYSSYNWRRSRFAERRKKGGRTRSSPRRFFESENST